MSTNAQPSSSDMIAWRVVVERSGTHYFYLVRMPSHLLSSVVEEKVLALYYRVQPWWTVWLCRPAIGIVTVVRSIDSESQSDNGQQVFVTRNCPSSFTPAAGHMFTVGFCSSLGTSSPPRAILLHPRLSHIGRLLTTLTVLLAIVAPGVLLGLLVGQAELGITLSAAIAGTFALAGNLCGRDKHPR